MRRAALLFIIALGGCVRPHYVPQYVDTPTEWRLEADEGSTLCNMRWWEELDDPVLDELIIVALNNNQDLQVAISRVFEYYARLGVVNSALYPYVTGNGSYNRIESSIAYPNVIAPNIAGLSTITKDFLAYPGTGFLGTRS